FEIPARYFRFVRTGDPRPLRDVIDHNRLDLLSLAGLAARLLRLIADGPASARDDREAFALGHVYARTGQDADARGAFEHVVAAAAHGAIRIAALRSLALAERRARRYPEAAARWREILESG